MVRQWNHLFRKIHQGRWCSINTQDILTHKATHNEAAPPAIPELPAEYVYPHANPSSRRFRWGCCHPSLSWDHGVQAIPCPLLNESSSWSSWALAKNQFGPHARPSRPPAHEGSDANVGIPYLPNHKSDEDSDSGDPVMPCLPTRQHSSGLNRGTRDQTRPQPPTTRCDSENYRSVRAGTSYRVRSVHAFATREPQRHPRDYLEQSVPVASRETRGIRGRWAEPPGPDSSQRYPMHTGVYAGASYPPTSADPQARVEPLCRGPAPQPPHEPRGPGMPMPDNYGTSQEGPSKHGADYVFPATHAPRSPVPVQKQPAWNKDDWRKAYLALGRSAGEPPESNSRESPQSGGGYRL
ncbi:hypothetical protein BOTBODRAFT_62476 [Botryobasidium botryosum FD-172 SS1]|uniref:Uncharacterized protein n=1 Tax=Botryobasidium botryosum (strain FD-172 SS1) TaxID=930990 RepID=A0A067MWL1_BOTB1|nr:hypothetical protein BOTBODRAFT_62476 [Botryobasidium botryosum FD-172 SS1]